MMTSAQVVKTSVTTTDNSPSQDYPHPDDQTTLLHVTPGLNHLLYGEDGRLFPQNWKGV